MYVRNVMYADVNLLLGFLFVNMIFSENLAVIEDGCFVIYLCLLGFANFLLCHSSICISDRGKTINKGRRYRIVVWSFFF